MRTTPPSKIKDFAHLPLHRGGFPLRRDWAKLKLFGTTGAAGGFLDTISHPELRLQFRVFCCWIIKIFRRCVNVLPIFRNTVKEVDYGDY